MTGKFGTSLRVITTVSTLALVSPLALAQAPAPATGPGGGAAAPRAQAPQPNPLGMEDVSKIKGAAVYDSTDKKIGSVSTVLMKPETKTIDRLVVGEGGVLGIGSHDVALPIDAFSWDAQKGAFRIAKSADDLKSMPAWQEQTAEAPRNGGAVRPRNGAQE